MQKRRTVEALFYEILRVFSERPFLTKFLNEFIPFLAFKVEIKLVLYRLIFERILTKIGNFGSWPVEIRKTNCAIYRHLAQCPRAAFIFMLQYINKKKLELSVG